MHKPLGQNSDFVFVQRPFAWQTQVIFFFFLITYGPNYLFIGIRPAPVTGNHNRMVLRAIMSDEDLS